MVGSAALDMVTEIIQGILAIMLVGFLGGIAVVDVVRSQPFTEPITLAVLAGSAVGFYFGQRNQRRQQETISSLTDKLINGGTK